MRMLLNSLDCAPAAQPGDSTDGQDAAQPAKDWNCCHAIVHSLQSLKNDETLVVEWGEPAGVFKTNSETPRAVIVPSNPASLATRRAREPEAERLGRALFGRDAARSWTSAGAEQALHTVFETFAAVGRARLGGDLAGRLIVSGGMGAAGGTQPLAATLAGAAFLGIDVDGGKITQRIRAGYCDFCVNSLDEALRILKNAVRQRHPVSVGLVGNCAEIIPELAARGVVPDILSDLTGAGDRLRGYVPAGLSLEQAAALRREHPEDYFRRACDSVARHARGMAELQKLGSVAFDFGSHLARMAREHCGAKDAVSLPHFVSACLAPAFSEGRAPLRWVALSGNAQDIRRADKLLLEMFADDALAAEWIRLAGKHPKFQGLPARAGWLRREQRAQYAERLNTLVAEGELKAPVVIARDLMDCDSEILRRMKSGGATGKGIPDALSNLNSGACWISLESEGAEAADTCCATQAALADGSPGARKRLQRLMESECEFSLFGSDRAGDEKALNSHRPSAKESRG